MTTLTVAAALDLVAKGIATGESLGLLRSLESSVDLLQIMIAAQFGNDHCDPFTADHEDVETG